MTFIGELTPLNTYVYLLSTYKMLSYDNGSKITECHIYRFVFLGDPTLYGTPVVAHPPKSGPCCAGQTTQWFLQIRLPGLKMDWGIWKV